MASPIETKFLDALLEHVPPDVSVSFGDDEYCGCDPCHSFDLQREVIIGSYRVDFMLSLDTGTRRWLTLECDGHDFHDRTKQQAAYDRARDRELLALGILTARFTGSEIHHSADRCATDAWRCARVLIEQENSELDLWTSAYDRGRLSVTNPRPRVAI